MTEPLGMKYFKRTAGPGFQWNNISDLCITNTFKRNKLNLAKYAYLGAPNMVKWDVPEKILQNAVQTH